MLTGNKWHKFQGRVEMRSTLLNPPQGSGGSMLFTHFPPPLTIKREFFNFSIRSNCILWESVELLMSLFFFPMVLSESKNCPFGQNFQYISKEASCVRCLVAVASVSHLNISFEGLMLFNAVEVKVLHNIVIKELLENRHRLFFQCCWHSNSTPH